MGQHGRRSPKSFGICRIRLSLIGQFRGSSFDEPLCPEGLLSRRQFPPKHLRLGDGEGMLDALRELEAR